MDKLIIERKGGFTGLKASGEVDASALDDATREAVEKLFNMREKPPASKGADRFVYVLKRDTGKGMQTVEVPEEQLPSALSGAVRDRLP
jgi:hypothetical protein